MSHPQPLRLSLPFQSKHEAIELGLELEKTFHSLSDVLRAETELAKAGRLRAASDLSPEKMRLTDAFLKMTERVRANSAFFREQLPELAARLQKLQGRFCEEVSRNLAALGTAKAIAESIIQEVADAAKENNRPSGYTAQGRSPFDRSNAAPPMKLNVSM